jgi:hypothetical protein
LLKILLTSETISFTFFASPLYGQILALAQAGLLLDVHGDHEAVKKGVAEEVPLHLLDLVRCL